MLQQPWFLSLLAVLISTISLVWNIVVCLAKRDKLKCYSYVYHNKEDDPIMEITMVNRGNLSVACRYYEIYVSENDPGKKTFFNNNRCVLLKRGELYNMELTVKYFADSATTLEENPVHLKIHIVDTLGRKYKVKNFEENYKTMINKIEEACSDNYINHAVI